MIQITLTEKPLNSQKLKEKKLIKILSNKTAGKMHMYTGDLYTAVIRPISWG